MAEGHVRAQAAVAELADLVANLRGGGLLERGRILARGMRLLRALTPKQRRTVAIEVARNAAPQLAERITAEGGEAGDVDLSPSQVKAVFDMVAALDEGSAGDLAAKLRDPGWQREALGLLATEGVDAVAAAAGYDEAGTLLGAHAPPQEVADREDGSGPTFDEGAVLADAAWDPDGGDGIGTELDDAAERARVVQADAERAAPPPRYEPTMPELASYDPAGIDPALLSFGTARAADPPGPQAAAGVPHEQGQAHGTGSAVRGGTDAEDRMHERSWFGGGDLGVGRLEAERTSLSDRLVRLERPSQRLRVLNEAVDDVAAMDVDEQVGVLLALPDGWVRRRALHRLLEASGVSQASAPRLLRTLGHDIDRAWVAASMVEHGIATIDDLAPALGGRARARLARRYDPPEV